MEKTGCQWRILSAQYGLVHPEEEIQPYEKTLNTMRVKERRASAPVFMADHLADMLRFYDLLERLEGRIGGKRVLADYIGGMHWPNRGVYFFCEAGESRSRSGEGLRVVRVGTYGLKAGSRSTLWKRLAQQQGIDLPPSWGVGGDPGAAARRLRLDRSGVKLAEAELEARVSHHIRAMPFLWLNVGDEPGPRSERETIERNAIALLSGYREPALDPPSPGWLGHSSDRWRVRRSGLWNNNHVDEDYDPSFLDTMEKRIGLIGMA